ncbi:MAG TPA: RNA pseudouridine synthase [Verrucomicrobiae bacterium]|nr:RNA pseudouridine synthase [Verrucomicrobiae bacterium]
MPRPKCIELNDGTIIPILYEDRSVIAIDKPAGWLLVPYNWDKTSRNLHLAISSSILAGDFWARSRSLKYLRNVHRLDADTSGILLMARSPGALHTFSRLFESRRMEKTYLAVVDGVPKETNWTCRSRIAPDREQIGRMKIDGRTGKEAETHLKVVQIGQGTALVEARPVTGRTHQIRVHLAAAGCPVAGDVLYGRSAGKLSGRERSAGAAPLGLRAIELAYVDPFQKRRVRIKAPTQEFCERFGFPDPDARRSPTEEQKPVVGRKTP